MLKLKLHFGKARKYNPLDVKIKFCENVLHFCKIILVKFKHV